jgi:predicted nucleotidyltransferase
MYIDINEVLKLPEYEFIYTEPRLRDKIALLTFGGSISYGLNTPESDIDIRGIVMPSMCDMFGTPYFINPAEEKNNRLVFGNEGFEQVTDIPTDTTIYSLDKIVKLLYKCNPNTIEILGCRPDHYAMVSEYGQRLIDNAHIFLSKLAYGSFAGYSRAQFQRLKNALGKDSASKTFQTLCLADNIERLQSHLEREYPGYGRDMIKLYITNTNGDEIYINGKPIDIREMVVAYNDMVTVITVGDTVVDDEDVELRCSINFENLPISHINGIVNEVNNAVKDFNKKLGNRNKKKDDYHLNKHAMHLIRLYLMAFDILTDGKIVTYREKEHDFLMDIKTGKYYNESNNSFSREFFDIVEDFDNKLKVAYEKSALPNTPDTNKIHNFIYDMKMDYANKWRG